MERRCLGDTARSQWERLLLGLPLGSACSCPATPGSSELQEAFKWEETEMEAELGRFPRGREGKYPRAEKRWRPGLCGRAGTGRLLKGRRANPFQVSQKQPGQSWTITLFLPQTVTERPRDRHSSFTGHPGTRTVRVPEKTDSSPTSPPPDSHRDM